MADVSPQGGSGVFLSTNNGANWTAANSGLPKYPSDSLYYLSINDFAVIPNEKGGSNLFAATFDGGVFLSTNNGTNWIEFNTGLPMDPYDTTHVANIRSFAIVGSNLFAGTYSRHLETSFVGYDHSH